MNKITKTVLVLFVLGVMAACVGADVFTNTVGKYLPQERLKYRTYESLDNLETIINDYPVFSYYEMTSCDVGTNAMTTDNPLTVGSLIVDAFFWPTTAGTSEAAKVSFGANTDVDLMASQFITNGMSVVNTCIQGIPDPGTATDYIVVTNSTVTYTVTEEDDDTIAGTLIIKSYPQAQ